MTAISRRLRYEILRRDNYACRYCGRSAPEVPLEVDAVVPEALGGSHKDPANLVAACKDCNGGKTSVPPDAPLVADVAQDAIRWANAMRAAQVEMCRDITERESIHRDFDYWWADWTYGPDDLRVPRPDDWRSSIDTFIDAGLPESALQECVRIAMSRKAAVSQKWRYMCGVAWKKVAELQERARLLAAESDPAADCETTPSDRAARRAMACELLGDLSRLEIETALDEARSILGSDDPAVEETAAFAEFHGAVRYRRQMTPVIRQLLEERPDGPHHLAEADAHLRKLIGTYDDTELVRIAALMLINSGQRAEAGA